MLVVCPLCSFFLHKGQRHERRYALPKAKLGHLCVQQHTLWGILSKLSLLNCSDNILTLMMDYWWMHSDKIPWRGWTFNVKAAATLTTVKTVALIHCWQLHVLQSQSPLYLSVTYHPFFLSLPIFPLLAFYFLFLDFSACLIFSLGPVSLLTPSQIYLHYLLFHLSLLKVVHLIYFQFNILRQCSVAW